MSVMTVYWIFFIVVGVIAIVTLYRLAKAALDIKQDFRECDTVETFLMAHDPSFPVLAFSKILPGIFVGFGILGTFLGFARGITGIDMNGTSEEIFEGIGGLLSGINSAFVTSIIGVIASAIFSFLFQIPVHSIKSFFFKLKKNREEEEKESGNSFDSYTNQVREFTQTLVKAKESVEALPEKFLDVGKVLNESVAPVKDVFAQMQDVIHNYSEQAKMMQEASNETKDSVQKLAESTDTVVKNISGIFEKSEELNKNITEENQVIVETHKKAMEDYAELDEKISSILEKLNNNLSAYSEAVSNSLVETLQHFTDAAQKVSESLLGD